MASFPVLSSGAVTQYPSPMTTTQVAEVIRFLDGADQRFIARGRALRSWQIRLNLLNETEIQQLEAFFVEQRGQYTMFDFLDPYSGTTVFNCMLGEPAFISSYEGVDVGAASLWVLETNGLIENNG